MISLSTSHLSKDEYYKQLRTIDRLDAETEHRLAVQYYEHGDLDAAKQLVLANLRFVAFIARRYKNHGIPFMDIVQEGNIGLMKAVKKFDPYAGVRLAAFAIHHIKASMLNFLIKNQRMVNGITTKPLRKLFFSKNEWIDDHMDAVQVDSVSVKYNVSAQDVRRVHSVCMGSDCELLSEEESPWVYVSDMESTEEIVMNADIDDKRLNALQVALGTLDERSRDIIEQRWLTKDKTTLHDLGIKYGVSLERIRQLESKAIKELGKHVKIFE